MYDTPDGQYHAQFNTLKDGLKKYKITPKADQSFFLDPAKSQENARTIITKMKDAGVTTMIYTGDPLTLYRALRRTGILYCSPPLTSSSVLTCAR